MKWYTVCTNKIASQQQQRQRHQYTSQYDVLYEMDAIFIE